MTRPEGLLWHRAEQMEMVRTRIVAALYHDQFEDLHDLQSAISQQLEHLDAIIEAMRGDSRQLKRERRERYERMVAREKKRIELGRIVPKGPRQEEML